MGQPGQKAVAAREAASGTRPALGSDRQVPALSRPQSHRLDHLEHEDLPIPEVPGSRRPLDGVDRLSDQVVLDDDLDLHLRHEVHDVLGAAVQLLVALLAAEAFHLGDGHAAHADGVEGVLHLVDPGGPDDRLDLLHLSPFPARPARSRRFYVTPPMAMAASGPTNPQAGVMATSPATAPDAVPRAVGFPRSFHSATIQPSAAAAAPVLVARKALAASPDASSALPALNPNQPNQSSPAPISVKGRLCGGIGVCGYPFRLPIISAQTSADVPDERCTTVPPAKSSAPSLRRKPPSAQTQCASGS